MSKIVFRKIAAAAWLAGACLPLSWAGRCPAAPAVGDACKAAPASAPAAVEAQTPRDSWIKSDTANTAGPVLLTEGSSKVIWQMLAYMLVIVLLGAVGLVVVKRVLPRIGVGIASGKRISTLETAHLGPRKTVYLLQVGAQKILIGSTREGLSMLADVTKAFEEGRAGSPD